MLIQQIMNGLTLGTVYALVAVGYSLIFGILRFVNFSHGAVYSFGAFCFLFFYLLDFGILPTLVLSLLLSGLVGFLIDKLALDPLRKRNSGGVTALITTIGVSYVIQNLLTVFFGSEIESFPRLFKSGSINIGNVYVSYTQIYIFVIAALLMIILSIIIFKTKLGLAIRAVQQNPKVAQWMGINVKSVISFIFFLSGVSAAIGSILVGSYYELVFPTMGGTAGLKAFAATVLGGIGSLHGSFIGGILVGVSESLAVNYFGGGYRDATGFIILFLVLIIRPTGLFGKKEIKKV